LGRCGERVLNTPCGARDRTENDLIAGPEIAETFEHLGLEEDLSLGRIFVWLSRCRVKIIQRRFDLADGLQLETHYGLWAQLAPLP
jgi:hypothetical protein